jgi:hypothetical protein
MAGLSAAGDRSGEAVLGGLDIQNDRQAKRVWRQAAPHIGKEAKR